MTTAVILKVIMVALLAVACMLMDMEKKSTVEDCSEETIKA